MLSQIPNYIVFKKVLNENDELKLTNTCTFISVILKPFPSPLGNFVLFLSVLISNHLPIESGQPVLFLFVCICHQMTLYCTLFIHLFCFCTPTHTAWCLDIYDVFVYSSCHMYPYDGINSFPKRGNPFFGESERGRERE